MRTRAQIAAERARAFLDAAQALANAETERRRQRERAAEAKRARVRREQDDAYERAVARDEEKVRFGGH